MYQNGSLLYYILHQKNSQNSLVQFELNLRFLEGISKYIQRKLILIVMYTN